MGLASSQQSQPQPAPAMFQQVLTPEQQQRMFSLMGSGFQPDVALRHHQLPRMGPPAPAPPVQQETFRVKNDFMVQKKSLQLEVKDNVVCARFRFHATAPCVVQIRYLATETLDDRNNSVT